MSRGEGIRLLGVYCLAFFLSEMRAGLELWVMSVAIGNMILLGAEVT